MRNTVSKYRDLLLLFISLITCTPLIAQNTIPVWQAKFIGRGLCVGLDPHDANTIYTEVPNAGIYVSHDKGKSWSPIPAQPPIQDLRQIFVSPDGMTLLTATCCGQNSSEGLYRSPDAGKSWELVLPSYGIDSRSITCDPAQPNTIYAAESEGATIYKSVDGGQSWAKLTVITDSAPNTPPCDICGLAVIHGNPKNTLLAGAGTGRIARSTDEGGHWEMVDHEQSEEVPQILFDKSNPRIGYAVLYGDPGNCGLLRTEDAGKTWLHTKVWNVSLWSLAIDPTNSQKVYAGEFDFGGNAVDFSDDGGQTFKKITAGLGANFQAWDLQFAANGSDLWLAGWDPQTWNAGVVYTLSQAKKNSVSGVVFDDGDGDGVAELSEPGLFHWPLTLTGSNGISRHVQTDHDGKFSFEGLSSGTYTLAEGALTGWLLTKPPLCAPTYTFTLADGDAIIDRDFWNTSMMLVEGFNCSNTLPAGWSVAHFSTGPTWSLRSAAPHSTPFVVADVRTNTTADDWLFSPGIPLTPEKMYQFGWWERSVFNTHAGIPKLTVTVGTSQTPAGMNQALYSASGFDTHLNYVPITEQFTVPSSSTYFFGFHDESGPSTRLRIDDVTLKYLYDVVPIDIFPADCDNIFDISSHDDIEVVIAGTILHPVDQIVPGSVTLEGIHHRGLRNGDFEGNQGNTCPSPADGVADLKLSFERDKVFQVMGAVSSGDERVLTLRGKLNDLTDFQGTAIVVIK